jgi:hypothetical protein
LSDTSMLATDDLSIPTAGRLLAKMNSYIEANTIVISSHTKSRKSGGVLALRTPCKFSELSPNRPVLHSKRYGTVSGQGLRVGHGNGDHTCLDLAMTSHPIPHVNFTSKQAASSLIPGYPVFIIPLLSPSPPFPSY